MASTSKPNFLIIVADDLGFTDTQPFGGEIHTPNLARLAAKGVRFTDFHTASACSPTRSMLLSGTDNHLVGLGQMAEFTKRYPKAFEGKRGYEGYLNERVAALPEILRDDGYYTFLSGKWHLGLLPGQWPVDRGFEKSFALLPGAGNHFKYVRKEADGSDPLFMPSLYVEDDKKLDAEAYLPEDFYSSNFFVQKWLEYKSSEKRQDRPFFSCLTFTAPHWPFQAPKDRIAKYSGRYDSGPAVLRQERLKRAVELGIIPDGVEPHQVETQRDKPWSKLTDEEKAVEAKIMEIYAAMVEIMDENVGKIIDELESSGELDNTFILFMSDNGAEGMFMEALPLAITNIERQIGLHYDNTFSNIGNWNSFVWYSDQWAQAATAPAYMYKMWASEGGIRCPLIVSLPDKFQEQQGKVLGGFATVMDILPTVLELAGVSHPGTTYRGREVLEPKGKSWVSYLDGDTERIHSEDTVTGWELFGQQAIRQGKYKALLIPKPFGPGKWQLFDLAADPGEIHDLADKQKAKLDEMLEHWANYVAETGLIECGEIFGSSGEDDYVRLVIED